MFMLYAHVLIRNTSIPRRQTSEDFNLSFKYMNVLKIFESDFDWLQMKITENQNLNICQNKL